MNGKLTPIMLWYTPCHASPKVGFVKNVPQFVPQFVEHLLIEALSMMILIAAVE